MTEVYNWPKEKKKKMETEISNIWGFCPVENFSISGVFYSCLGQNADMLTIVF